MAITKEKIAKMEVVGQYAVQVATDTVIKEDGTEISLVTDIDHGCSPRLRYVW